MFEKTTARIIRPAALLAIGALLVAACSSAATSSPVPTATATTPTATVEATATATEAAAGTTVNVATGAVGSYLTGKDGLTLYVKQGDSTSAPNCTGACLDNWPAFTVQSGEHAVAGTGVSGTLATFVRTDTSATQVTYNGAPLYYFKTDTAAGDTNGQGVGGVWSVAAP
jgi:predicted lipoprotein with Yx(FWY)xxD motif